MAADSDKFEVVCPEIESLTEVQTDITCPVENCTKILANSSALRMHLEKTHKTAAKECNVFGRGVVCRDKVKKNIVYCCPVSSCVRRQGSGRYFNRLAHVKQHYMNVHGEKKFTCKKCEKKFGRNDVCLRHEKTCGMIFLCSCGVEFTCRTSMLTHARRNGHVLSSASNESGERPKEMKSKVPGSVGGNQVICISLLPVDNKSVSAFVRQIKPKKMLCEIGTQTDQPPCTTNIPLSLVPSDKTSSVNESSLHNKNLDLTLTIESSLLTDNNVSSQKGDVSLLLQNEECCSSKDGSLSMGKGIVDTELEKSDTDMSCKHTQTVEYLQIENFDVDFTIDNEDFKELAHTQTQTNLDLTFDNFPLFEDNETQTLESYLDIDPSTIDCATQTILDEIFSVDNETQTRLPTIDFDDDFDSLHCGNSMDGQTQTTPWTNFTGTSADNLDILQSSANSSTDGQTQTLPWSDFGASFNILESSAGSSVDGQTQTIPWVRFADSPTFNFLQGPTSNVETQTMFNAQICHSENVKGL